MCANLNSLRLADEVDYFSEQDQAEADAIADANWERQEEIERGVTFDDVLEEMATSFDDEDKEIFSYHLARQRVEDACALMFLIHEAKQRVIDRRLTNGE